MVVLAVIGDIHLYMPARMGGRIAQIAGMVAGITTRMCRLIRKGDKMLKLLGIFMLLFFGVIYAKVVARQKLISYTTIIVVNVI